MYLLLWPELFLQDRMSWVGCLWEREGRKGWVEGVGGGEQGVPGGDRVQPVRGSQGGKD